MACSSAAWLGRRVVDLVRQDDVREDRAGKNSRKRRPVSGSSSMTSVPVIGRHEVRSELNAAEVQLQGLGDGRGHQRFAKSGQAQQQHMTATQQADQNQLERLALAIDGLGHLVHEGVVRLPESLDQHQFIRLLSHGRTPFTSHTGTTTGGNPGPRRGRRSRRRRQGLGPPDHPHCHRRRRARCGPGRARGTRPPPAP